MLIHGHLKLLRFCIEIQTISLKILEHHVRYFTSHVGGVVTK